MQKKVKEVPELDAFLKSLKVGESSTYKNVTIYPIFSEEAGSNGYKLLDEATKTDLFLVTEVSHAGSVPELLVINKLDSDVLILDGEELVGAKQNRIVNTTLIIAKGKEVVIPVSCVEQGRWTYRNKRFHSSKWTLSADIRREKSRAVKENLRTCYEFRSNQARIWNKISEKAVNLESRSETSAMDRMFETHEGELKTYEEAFQPQEGQIGFIACIDGKIEGCDIIALKALYPKIHTKMLRGYLLDAVERAKPRVHASTSRKAGLSDDVNAFLERVKASQKESFKSAGEGRDIRLDGAAVDGFAMLRDSSVIHVAAFQEV